jgi:hypothetical protein
MPKSSPLALASAGAVGRLSRRAAIAKRIARTTNQTNSYPSYVTTQSENSTSGFAATRSQQACRSQCTLHGLRKPFAWRCFEAGCTVPETAGGTGHLTLREVQRYAV